MLPRGSIRNREYAQRLRDFSGMVFGKITPTDIDGFIEFGDRVFVFIEAKYGKGETLGGQRLALQRLVDALWKAGKESILFLCNYEGTGDIDFANAMVSELRYRGQWRPPRKPVTLRFAVDEFLRMKREAKR